ncbi:hypothetical protein NC797_13785 [Aquibacillus sp. 3ASR75-11]|uniref:Uncharacterized protein n=1 Tax=Terrihalobacillus insolitus TaxID=2950438 RepID=A0A9X4APH8_9BACI|nr:hypothetical protein [Terrihalobacillus insolitus]MDC3413714.1 hypothetical protein [Terrihalobacillus insolitus]MDC3425573.1 hypothetical protein [Terrihalobacillus insolitus]
MKTLSPNFIIGSIQIGTIESASCVNFGNNFPKDFTSNKKQNQGFGSISGDNNDISDIFSRLDEKDIKEVFHQSQAGQYPEWLHKLIEEQDVDIEQDFQDDEPEP